MKTLFFSSILLFSASLTSIQAQLPFLGEKPWLGYFAGYDRHKFAIGIKSDGTIELEIKDKSGKRMSFSKGIIIAPAVMAEGEKGWYPLTKIRESMSTDDKPSEEPRKMTYRGKVTGGAEYECIVEFDRDKISFGGKLIDKGATTKPLKFQMRCRFQNPYKGSSPENAKRNAARDTIKFLKPDNKKGQCGVFDEVDFADQKKFGPLTSLEVEMKSYMNYRLMFHGQGATTLRLENPNEMASAPMDGFAIVFEPDPAKDPKSSDRMVFELK